MNRKQTYWVVDLFFIVLLIGSLVGIPARHVLRFVELPADIKIKGLNGSITSGNIEAIRYQKFTLTDVDFSLRPLCLAKISICYEIKSDDNNLLLNIEANLLTQISSISHSQIQLDSSIFKDMPQMLVQPKGELLIAIQSMTFVDAKINELSATLDWPGAGIEGEDQLLGNYHATLLQEEERLSIKLDDKDSLLSARGDIEVKWSGQYSVNLKFESKPELNKSVINVLQMATRQSGLNKYALKTAGNLPSQSMQYLQLFNTQK